jgi:hypothetical protein
MTVLESGDKNALSDPMSGLQNVLFPFREQNYTEQWLLWCYKIVKPLLIPV